MNKTISAKNRTSSDNETILRCRKVPAKCCEGTENADWTRGDYETECVCI